MERLKDILGYNIKMVERTGTPLKLMFPLSKKGEGGAEEKNFLHAEKETSCMRTSASNSILRQGRRIRRRN